MCSSAALEVGADTTRGEKAERGPDVGSEVVTLPTVTLVLPRRLITNGNLTRATTGFCVELMLPISQGGRDYTCSCRVSARSR